MALKKECPRCRYRNSQKKRKCVKCGASLEKAVYWADLWISPGKRVFERIGPSRTLAEARELELKRQKARAKVEGKYYLASSTRLEDLWVRYYSWSRSHNKSPQTKI